MQKESLYQSVLVLLLLLAGCDLTGPPAHWKSVTAIIETQAVKRAGDAADDVAIWRNPRDPAASLIIATDKRTGLYVYDLSGKELSYLPVGEPINVDLRELSSADGGRYILVAVSERQSNAVLFYILDEDTGGLRPVPSDLGSELGEIYGLCMYQPSPDIVEVFALGRSGRIERYQAWIKATGRMFMGRLASFGVPSQAEGCIADDEVGSLYIAEESTGIWRFDLSDKQPQGKLMARISSGHLVADIEGLALGQYGGVNYLVASSQGNDSFVIYEETADQLIYRGTFIIVAGDAIDGVSESDGIELVSMPLGDRFPQGLLVVQDGDNAPANQNFKLISWQDIADAFAL